MRTFRLILLVVLLALVVVVVVNKCSGDKGAIAQQQKGGAMRVTGTVVTGTMLEDRITATGTLMADNSIDLRNEMAGRLVSLGFKEGQHVEKGALLAKIDDSDLQAQLRKALANEELAKTTLARQKDLLGVNGVSQQDYDAAVNALDGVQADIALARSQIAKTEVRAPFSGTVGLRNVSEGAYLPAFTVIAALQQLDPMKLEFTIPERYHDRLSIGDSISFTLESSTTRHQGSIYAFEPGVDPQTGSLRARALCRNGGKDLMPGAFAKVTVPLKRIANALMVPTQAVVPVLNGQQVMLCKNGKAKAVPVETGLRNDSTVQVVTGVQAGDTVLTSGFMQLRPGMPVHVAMAVGGQWDQEQ